MNIHEIIRLPKSLLFFVIFLAFNIAGFSQGTISLNMRMAAASYKYTGECTIYLHGNNVVDGQIIWLRTILFALVDNPGKDSIKYVQKIIGNFDPQTKTLYFSLTEDVDLKGFKYEVTLLNDNKIEGVWKSLLYKPEVISGDYKISSPVVYDYKSFSKSQDKKFVGQWKILSREVNGKPFKTKGNTQVDIYENGEAVFKKNYNNDTRNVAYIAWYVKKDTLNLSGDNFSYTLKNNILVFKDFVDKTHAMEKWILEKTSSDPYKNYSNNIRLPEAKGDWEILSMITKKGPFAVDNLYWDIHPRNDQKGEIVQYRYDDTISKEIAFDSLRICK